jgi:hypothetical protein
MGTGYKDPASVLPYLLLPPGKRLFANGTCWITTSITSSDWRRKVVTIRNHKEGYVTNVERIMFPITGDWERSF